MRARVEHFVAFFIKTFLLVIFIFGSLGSIFTADRGNPGLEPEIMLLVAVIIAILGLVMTFRDT